MSIYIKKNYFSTKLLKSGFVTNVKKSLVSVAYCNFSYGVNIQFLGHIKSFKLVKTGSQHHVCIQHY